MDIGMVARAQGCLLGQLAGDALGGQVEFSSPEKIARSFPNGVRELRDGGTWRTIAGQPTDDSEMALLLARMLARQGYYDEDEARKEYLYWLSSGPFDVGNTIRTALHGRPSTSLYRLLYSASLEEALVETVMCGGDTDTNAAIAGALLGAVHGREAVPQRWIQCLLHCRPVTGSPGVERPRPEVFWPVDSLELAPIVLLAGASKNPTALQSESRST